MRQSRYKMKNTIFVTNRFKIYSNHYNIKSNHFVKVINDHCKILYDQLKGYNEKKNLEIIYNHFKSSSGYCVSLADMDLIVRPSLTSVCVITKLKRPF